MNEVNKTSPAISIIVPIYNMEKLMRKCLDSILAQTFQDYECLLIDDGSKDGSPAICDEYAAKDCRFKAFHKVNGGLSDARNYGLVRAKGEYTIFFDPDDWVDVDCLKDMYAKAQKTDADMVICDFYEENGYRTKVSKQIPSSLYHKDVLKDVLIGRIMGSTCNKLIRRSLYQTYQIEYPMGIYGCEDQYTMCKLLKNDIKVAYHPQAYYHYVYYGNGTQSRYYDENTYEMDKRIVQMFVDLFDEQDMIRLAYARKISYLVGHAFINGKRFFSNRQFVYEFRQYEGLLKRESSQLFGCLYWISFRGFYHFAINTLIVLMKCKKIVNKSIQNGI